MHLLGGTVREIKDRFDGSVDAVAAECADRFAAQHGQFPEDAEVRSWRNSWPVLVDSLVGAGLADLSLLFEYTLAGSSERVDALLLGARPGGGVTGVVVELKQWSEVDWATGLEVAVRGRTSAHPARQARGYVSHLENWLEAAIELEFRGAAVLHNAPLDMVSRLRAEVVGSLGSRDVPLIGKDDLASALPLTDLLGCADLAPLSASQHDAFLAARQRPAPSVFEQLDAVLAGESGFTLLGEQQRVQLEILRAVRSTPAGSRKVIAVSGGPGTGKTVIALRLLADLPRSGGPHTRFLTPSGTLRRNLVDPLSSTGARNLFLHPTDYLCQRDAGPVVPLVDEAQRLRRNGSLVADLVLSTRVSVFFLDERQVIRPTEGVGVAELRETAARLGASFSHFELTSQYRCGGSLRYLNWLDALLDPHGEPARWTEGNDYEVGLAGTPLELERWAVERGSGTRISAGFCWPWSPDRPGGGLVDDVVVDWVDEDGTRRHWQRPWNSRQSRRNGPTPIPQKELWATRPGGEAQIGCIYTCQALQYEHSGVIIGPDLVRRDGRWVGVPSASHDPSFRNVSVEDYLGYALNTYWVLATRGTRGCRFLSVDGETQAFLRDLL